MDRAQNLKKLARFLNGKVGKQLYWKRYSPYILKIDRIESLELRGDMKFKMEAFMEKMKTRVIKFRIFPYEVAKTWFHNIINELTESPYINGRYTQFIHMEYDCDYCGEQCNESWSNKPILFCYTCQKDMCNTCYEKDETRACRRHDSGLQNKYHYRRENNRFGNFFQWIPYIQDQGGDCILINCNPKSRYFQRLAIAIDRKWIYTLPKERDLADIAKTVPHGTTTPLKDYVDHLGYHRGLRM